MSDDDRQSTFFNIGKTTGPRHCSSRRRPVTTRWCGSCSRTKASRSTRPRRTTALMFAKRSRKGGAALSKDVFWFLFHLSLVFYVIKQWHWPGPTTLLVPHRALASSTAAAGAAAAAAADGPPGARVLLAPDFASWPAAGWSNHCPSAWRPWAPWATSCAEQSRARSQGCHPEARRRAYCLSCLRSRRS
jgi:hypothetical protein